MKKDEICYPYAYGRLDESLISLTENFKNMCDAQDIAIDAAALDLLETHINKLRKTAREASYKFSDILSFK